MKAQRVAFHAPDGVVPEGTAVGEGFDLVCTFRLERDGKVCLTVIGDSKMPGYDSKPEPKPAYGSMMDEMHQGEGDA